MRKRIASLIFLMVLASYGFSTAGPITETETLNPFSTNVTGRKPAYVQVGQFTFDQIDLVTGTITSAIISGKWSGKLGMNQHVYLYLGDSGEDRSTWIQVADLYNPITSWRLINSGSNPRKSNYTNMDWVYTFSDFASLKTALDDGTVDLIIGGKPSKIKKVSLGQTTFTIVDPPIGCNNETQAVPEPTTMLLIGSGLLGLLGARKKLKK